ncbi:MAG: hypothetical protein ACYSWO_24505 [Planctomycetota bacterium]
MPQSLRSFAMTLGAFSLGIQAAKRHPGLAMTEGVLLCHCERFEESRGNLNYHAAACPPGETPRLKKPEAHPAHETPAAAISIDLSTVFVLK